MSNILSMDIHTFRPDNEKITEQEAVRIMEDVLIYLESKGYTSSVLEYNLLPSNPMPFQIHISDVIHEDTIIMYSGDHPVAISLEDGTNFIKKPD